MDFWPTFIAALTTIVLNVLLVIDWIGEHKEPDESTKVDEPKEVDKSDE